MGQKRLSGHRKEVDPPLLLAWKWFGDAKGWEHTRGRTAALAPENRNLLQHSEIIPRQQGVESLIANLEIGFWIAMIGKW